MRTGRGRAGGGGTGSAQSPQQRSRFSDSFFSFYFLYMHAGMQRGRCRVTLGAAVRCEGGRTLGACMGRNRAREAGSGDLVSTGVSGVLARCSAERLTVREKRLGKVAATGGQAGNERESADGKRACCAKPFQSPRT